MDDVFIKCSQIGEIFDGLSLGVVLLSRDGRILSVNRSAELLTGCTASDAVGKYCHLVFGEYLCGGLCRYLEVPESEREKIVSEVRVGDRIKGHRPIKKIEAPLYAEDNRLIGCIQVFHDHPAFEEGPRHIYGYDLPPEDGTRVGELVTIKEKGSGVRGPGPGVQRTPHPSPLTPNLMVGNTPAMRKIFDTVQAIAATSATVLIEGPTGTGKNLLAGILHRTGTRAEKQMVKVNCAALPDHLLESELFGYVKGAFTGADRDKPGRFQEADRGTIFLDEIGDLPLPLQGKLLRVLEDKEFYPLGSRKTAKVDVRIISATNRNLGQLVRQKLFREDLFYRINVMRLELPALRERKADIPLLVSHIVRRLCAAEKKAAVRISEEAMSLLLNYDYPGNVREMENILGHALILCRNGLIEPGHFPLSILKNADEDAGTAREYDSFEKDRIILMLKKYGGQRGLTAQALDMDRSTLWRKMKKYGLKARFGLRGSRSETSPRTSNLEPAKPTSEKEL